MKQACKICGNKTRIKYRQLYDDRHGYPGRFDLRECVSCGFMQTAPQLTTREIAKIYSKHYPRAKISPEQVLAAAKNIPSKETIEKKGLGGTCHLDTKPGERVLDIGSGAGYSLAEIKALGGVAYGVDPDKNAERIARKLGFKFHLGFLHNSHFPKKHFDLITASQVLEHPPDPVRLLIACKSYLKPGGRIRMSFPNTGALYRSLWGKAWLHWHVPYHLNHFNKTSVEIMAKKAGLKIRSIKTVTPNLWTVLQIRSWVSQVRMGERNTMWDTGRVDEKKIEAKKDWLKSLSLRFLPMLEDKLFFNRILDWFGRGESFVVEFRLC